MLIWTNVSVIIEFMYLSARQSIMNTINIYATTYAASLFQTTELTGLWKII